MKKITTYAWYILLIVSICSLTASADRIITDGRGEEVTLPDTINRVISFSDGLVESTMYYLGEEETLVGIGSDCLGKDWEFTFETINGETYDIVGGTNPFSLLYPQVKELPLVAKYDTAPNYELMVKLEPDVAIIRAGSCTFWTDEEIMNKAIGTIESLGIPVVVVYGPNVQFGPDNNHDMTVISDEIRIIGSIFGKEEQSDILADYLEKQVTMIQEQTQGVSDADKPSVLILGLSPQTRKSGSAGDVMGTDTLESYFIEDVINARNAFNEPGYFMKVNAEQILALNPDVILLSTDWGYHPARELYEAPYYQNLQELDAVKNKRVYAMPWMPCNCDKRIEYPIEMMVIAKAAYPSLFEQINLSEWLLDFYQEVYRVDRQTATELRSAQLMDWTVNADI